MLLAHYLDQAYGSRLNGMRVLEVGAGTGLAGIVSASVSEPVLLCVVDRVSVECTILGPSSTLIIGARDEFLRQGDSRVRSSPKRILFPCLARNVPIRTLC